MTSVVLVVFDGLRPDMIRPETTPNLVRFAAMGTRLPGARAVFPSETRVCTASVSTGCHPRRHGIVANAMFHPVDPARTVRTGDAAALRDLEQDIGGPALMMPSLSDLLAACGRDYAVFSSGTTGQTFLLAPRAAALGQTVVSVHGAQACSPAGQAILARLDPPPADPAARAVWIADAWRTTVLAHPPAASVLWLCEPDTAAHHLGLDSAAQRDVLRRVDAAFGRILDDWQVGAQRDHLQMIVASDHGHITGTAILDTRAAFAAAPELAGCIATGGGIWVPGATRERIEAAAGFLMRQDWIANLFGVDSTDRTPGVLPHNAALVDHPRTGHLLYTLRNTPAPGPTGLPGSTIIEQVGGLAVGAGTHGGLNRGELATVLMLAGSRIRPGLSSDWPAGLVDIAPTILSLLGEAGGAAMDGRVLEEAFRDGSEPAASRSPETWEAVADGYAQRVARMRVGRHVILELGERM